LIDLFENSLDVSTMLSKSRIVSRLLFYASILVVFALLALFPLEQVRRVNRKLLSDILELKLDLEAHQEALKISREKCDAKIQVFQENEKSLKETVSYYKEAEDRLSKEWCQKFTDGALAEYKKVCRRSIDEYSAKVSKLVKERDALAKRLEPVAMCCKSATARSRALASGLDEDTARRKGAQAVAASVRAMEDAASVKFHTQRVVWSPKAEERQAQPKRQGGSHLRVSGLGEEEGGLLEPRPQDGLPMAGEAGGLALGDPLEPGVLPVGEADGV